MHGSNTLYFVGLIVGWAIAFTSIGAVSVANFKNRNKQQTDSNLKEAYAGSQALVTVLKEQNRQYLEDIRELREKYSASQKEIGELRGQMQSIRDVPLERISSALDTLNQNQASLATQLIGDRAADIIKPIPTV